MIKSLSFTDIIDKHPYLLKIDEKSFYKCFKEVSGSYPQSSSTFGDQGFDDLDCVELILKLEQECGISISDDIAELIIDPKASPMALLKMFISEKRERRINIILNE